MLDKQKIAESEHNVKTYLAEGLLKKVSADKRIIQIFLINSKESLIVAEETYQKNLSDLWTIVCSYYSMYYYANAVLLKYGYKVGDKIVHKVTSDALITYIRNKLKESLIETYEETRDEALSIAGIKADNIIELFEFERIKRNTIQYNTLDSNKHSKASTSLHRAKDFIQEMEKLFLEI